MATNMKKFYENMDEFNFLAPKTSIPGEVWLADFDELNYVPEHDILFLNSKFENGVSLYTKFVEKYYFNGVKILQRQDAIECFPIINSNLNINSNRRELFFDYRLTLTNYLYLFFGPDSDFEIPDNVDALAYVKEKFRWLRQSIKNVISYGETSPDSAEISPILSKLLNNEDKDVLIPMLTDYIVTISNFQKNMEKNPTIDLEKFKSCFDIDKLYLIIAKLLLNKQKFYWNTEQIIIPLYSQLIFYMSNVLENTEGITYNPIIRFYNTETKKIEKYSLQTLKREMFALEKEMNSKEYKGLAFENTDLSKLANNIKTSDFLAAINKDDFTALQMSWTFIPAGTTSKEEPEVTSEPVNNPTEPIREKKITIAEAKKSKNNAALYHKLVLDKTNYKCKIVGKEKFAGYIGYIYDNGLVAFEKIYENNLKEFSQSSNATYIMKFTNFAKFTRLTKQEIITYIKNTANPEVKRFYHSASWERKLLNFLNGIAYNDEINALIDAFIETQKEYKISLDKE